MQAAALPLFHPPGPPGFSAVHAGLPGRRPAWFQYTSFAAGAHLLFAGKAAGHKKCAARKKGQRISNVFAAILQHQPNAGNRVMAISTPSAPRRMPGMRPALNTVLAL